LQSALSSASAQPAESLNGQFWHLLRVMADQAWQVTTGKEDITIAVLDTGIDEAHPALTGKVIANINFTTSMTAADRNGHGTHIAGIIAGKTNQSGPGLAPGSTLMNVKVANDDGSVSTEAVVKGIRWATDNGANIINISLSIDKPSVALEEAVDYAWQRGAIVVTAAGNAYAHHPTYPAFYSSTISVVATDYEDNITPWSNRGDWVDVSAPGAYIYSTAPRNTWSSRSGTSMAAALVSAEAALLFSIASDMNGNGKINDEVRQAIQVSCDGIGDNDVNHGRINVFRAIDFLSSGSL